MEMVLLICGIIATLALVYVTVFVVRALSQVRRTARGMEMLLGVLGERIDITLYQKVMGAMESEEEVPVK